MGSTAELQVLAGQTNQLQIRRLLVKNEYVVDRLTKQIFDLQSELSRAREEFRLLRKKYEEDMRFAVVFEVTLFAAGLIIGGAMIYWIVR
jgi:Cft2 family RNA processing exonuclease